MSRRIEVIDENNVRVTEQAKILGFIDTGSIVSTVYRRVNKPFDRGWRSTIDGYEPSFTLAMDINQAVEAWQFLKTLDQMDE